MIQTTERIFRLTLPTHDLQAFLRACEHGGWAAMDTGERIMTDEGADAEAILLVEPLAQVRPAVKLLA